MGRDYPALTLSLTSGSDEEAELILAAVDDFQITAVDQDGAALRIFFATHENRDRAAIALRERSGVEAGSIDVPDENWAERSQASLTAVRAGALTIAPPWDAAASDRASTVVILPSMGFGTGHHATTRLCLRALQQLGVRGKSVLDVGTGSGVLALAALKLGASRVIALDNDPDAVANARENAALNALPLDVRCAGLESAGLEAEPPFDLVVANLTGGVLIRCAKELEAFAGGGTLVLSGLRDEETDTVRAAFTKQFATGDEQDGWRCLVLL